MVPSPLCSSSPNGRRAAAHNACYCITMENSLLWSFYPKIHRFFLCGCGEEGLDKSFVQTAFLFQRCFHAVDTTQCIGEHCCAQQVQPAVASLIQRVRYAKNQVCQTEQGKHPIDAAQMR